MELFKILQQSPSDVLIMDVRPRNIFSDSHIKFDCCISIPEEILEAGFVLGHLYLVFLLNKFLSFILFFIVRSSAAKLAEKLPLPSKLMWGRRTEVKYLVLMDWFSSASNLKEDSHLHRLQTIILKVVLSVPFQPI